MNIFYLHSDPKICAESHCFKHLTVMAKEAAQILSNVHYNNPNNYTPKYKRYNPNHPACLWAGKSLENYLWLCELGLNLCQIYTRMYEKKYKSHDYIEELKSNLPNIKSDKFYPMVQIMPDDVRDTDSRIAYRKYYIHHKSKFAKWTTAKGNSMPVPNWYAKKNPYEDLE